MGEARGLDLPERVRRSIAAAVAQRGVQARVISTRGRDSMRPPQGHIIVAAEGGTIDAVRGPSRVVRRLEFYKTFYGPVVRLAFSQVSGDAALSGLGRQKSIVLHFYHADGEDLTYAFSKEVPNGPEQREEAKKVLKMARDTYTETSEERRSFPAAVGLAERQFELPVSV